MVEGTGGGFSADQTQTIMKKVIETVLGQQSYTHNQVNQWTSLVVEGTLEEMAKLNKPYKYIVNCVIMQRVGAGLHLASSCYWDASTDGSATFRWENKSMYAVVSVFALAV